MNTADLCDAYGDELRYLHPLTFRDFGGRKRFEGEISTVKCHDDNSKVKEALNEPGKGRVGSSRYFISHSRSWSIREGICAKWLQKSFISQRLLLQKFYLSNPLSTLCCTILEKSHSQAICSFLTLRCSFQKVLNKILLAVQSLRD